MKISIHETGIDAQYVVTTSYDLTFSQLSKNLISNTKPVAQKSMKKETLSRKERKANKNSAGQAPEEDWTTLAATLCNVRLES